MADPRRLLDEPGGSPLSRSLLSSAQRDQPSRRGRVRAAKRLGIAALLFAGTGAGSEIGAAAAVWKLAAVVVAIGGTVGLVIWRGASSEQVPPSVSAVVAAHSDGRSGAGSSTAGTAVELQPDLPAPAAIDGTGRQAGSNSPTSSRSAGVTTPAWREPTARVAAAHRPAAPAPIAPAVPEATATTEAEPIVPTVTAATDNQAAPEPPAAEPAAELPAAPAIAPVEPAPVAAAPEPPRPALTPSRLAAEVALVDRARDALRTGDNPAALAALTAYHQQFPQGDLDAEADLVMIETQIAQHDYPRARDLATAFLAHFPRSPLSQRVHSLLDHLPK